MRYGDAMNIASFDTHVAVKELRELGFKEEQAEGVVKIIRRNNENSLAVLVTKGDLAQAVTILESKIGGVETKLSAELVRVETKLTGDLKSLEEKLVAKIASSQLTATRWLIGAMFTLAALVFTAVKFIH